MERPESPLSVIVWGQRPHIFFEIPSNFLKTGNLAGLANDIRLAVHQSKDVIFIQHNRFEFGQLFIKASEVVANSIHPPNNFGVVTLKDLGQFRHDRRIQLGFRSCSHDAPVKSRDNSSKHIPADKLALACRCEQGIFLSDSGSCLFDFADDDQVMGVIDRFRIGDINHCIACRNGFFRFCPLLNSLLDFLDV